MKKTCINKLYAFFLFYKVLLCIKLRARDPYLVERKNNKLGNSEKYKGFPSSLSSASHHINNKQ